MTDECRTPEPFSPVSVPLHQTELKSNQSVQIGVVVPGRLVQEEDVPVGGDEHEAGETVEAAQHDAQSAFIYRNNKPN